MRKKLILILALALYAVLLPAFAKAETTVSADAPDPVVVASGTYRSVLSAWVSEALPDTSGILLAATPETMTGGELLGPAESAGRASSRAFAGEPVAFAVTVPTTGLYTLAVEYRSASETHGDLEIRIDVDAELPYQEARQIALPKGWRQADPTFAVDRYGNDFYGLQEQVFAWRESDLGDPMGLYDEPLRFRLEAGEHTIAITCGKGDFLLGDVTVKGVSALPDYAEYAAAATIADAGLAILEAETPAWKSASTIQPGVSRDGFVTPFAVSELRLNVLDGGSWQNVREEVGYDVDVPAAGWYRLTFKVLQNAKTNGVVYRTLRINGTVPFAEANAIPFAYATRWQNVTPADAAGTPFLFWLEAGANTLSLSVNLAPSAEVYATVRTVLAYVNAASLEIRKLTGNQLDEDRDWNLADYMPSLSTDLYAFADALEEAAAGLAAASPSARASENESALRIAVRNLRFLAADPDQIPRHIDLLSASSSSIAQTLGTVVNDLLASPLTVDRIYVHADVELPPANQGFFGRVWLGIRRFFLSFFEDRYRTVADPDELQVWVNRPKPYADLIQKLADEEFTTTTGIRVQVSLLADEGKLILANSADRAPDVALGISSWMPYDLGIRGALADLAVHEEEPGFAATLSLFPTQSLLPMVYDGGLYGLPDTENFYVLFYRTDVLEALDLEVPDTWDDVVGIMPVLRRYGMNFYLPLSSPSSLKAFDATLPFLFQYGSPVYAADALSADLNNAETIAALRMMTELYAIYGLETTVSSFYNDFRLGVCPIGVGDFGMYIRLLNAAPDIQGLWAIAPMPGVLKDGGVVDRSAPGAQTANVVFAKSDKQDEAWAFLQWWASTSTQTTFQEHLLATLGREYLWNSANTEAFAAAGYDAIDMATILLQRQWLRELPKVPGAYQVELEISNLWNSVVLDRENLRVRLNDALVATDREIRKKMAEFGYLAKDGTILRPYVMADPALIEAWRAGGGG